MHKPKEDRYYGRHSPRWSPPPPLAESVPALWQQLPLPNRSRLLWLLSQLLERQLQSTTDEEGSDETDADNICG
ncbi:MAG: hypothetical protein V3R80_04895 [Candidatus Tectomicrobia bacterium]